MADEKRKIRDFGSAVTSGKIAQPLRVLIYGVPGVGKSTLASQAPNPLFVGAEEGSGHINTNRLAPVDWVDYMDLLDWFATSNAVNPVTGKPYETLVLDTADAVEKMAIDYCCLRDNGTKDAVKKYDRNTWVDGKANLDGYGYGGGPKVIEQEWIAMLAKFDVARRKRGVNVVMVAHSDNFKEKNAAGDDYGIIAPQLLKYNRDQSTAWSDAVLFCEYGRTEIQEAEHSKDGKQIGKAKVVTSGKRIVHAERGGAFVAKNRLGLPSVIEMSWKVIADAATLAYGDAAVQITTLREEIDKLLLVAPESIRPTVRDTIEKFSSNVLGLIEVKARLQTRIAEAAVAHASANSSPAQA